VCFDFCFHVLFIYSFICFIYLIIHLVVYSFFLFIYFLIRLCLFCSLGYKANLFTPFSFANNN
jgi:hypothetical protein